jgi:hypothetical protein
MKSKTFLNDGDFFIVLKTPEDFSWQTTLASFQTPMTVTFAISSTTTPKPTIKKIIWDLGNGNQPKSFTNRKFNLYDYTIECKYRKSNDTTISIQASVYTDEGMFVTPPIIGTTVNDELKNHYVEPKVFEEQILKYYKTNIFTDDIAESIYKIANRLAFAPNFINYTYREEMVGDAVVRMIEALTTQKYDTTKGNNPFSYFSKIAWHAFCNRIKKEKKIREALENYQNAIYNEMIGDGTIPYTGSHNSADQDEFYSHEDT